MADRFGKFLVNVTGGTKQSMAPGSSSNSAVRKFKEVFLLDDGNANNLIGSFYPIGVFRGGDVPDWFDVSANAIASLAGSSFSIGTRANPTKYSAALAGPVAGATVRVKAIDTGDIGLNTVPFVSEEVGLTITVAILPVAAGAKLQVDTYYSHK